MVFPRWLPILALLLPATAGAQRYLVHTYSETDGLPSTVVRSVVQDPSGLIWIATRAGIASYDGARWTRHTVAEGLLEADQAHLSVDEQGRIWAVALHTPVRVAYYEGGEWKQIPGPGDTSRGQVLAFATVSGQGLDHILVTLSSGELWCRCGGNWHRNPIESRPSAVVAHGDHAFVGTDRGLRVLDLRPDGAAPADVEVPAGGVRGLARDPDTGALWVVGSHWIGLLRDDRFTTEWTGENFGLPASWGVVAAEADGAGGLYFGNPVRLLHYRPGHDPEPLGLANGLISEGASSLLLDAEHNLWVGGLRGLSKIASFRFATWDSEHGLQDDEVTVICRRRSGEIVLGHPKGLTFWGDPFRRVPIANPAVVERVLGISEGTDGTLWVAAHLGGLGEIAPDGTMTMHASPAGPASPVMSVLADSRGRLWIGSGASNPLLMREDGDREDGEWKRIDLPIPSGQNAYTRRILKAESGTIYVATHGAAAFRVDESGAHPLAPDGAGGAGGADHPSSSTYTVLEHGDDTVWVGTLDGLYRVDDGAMIRETRPRIDRPVYLAFHDKSGNAWFGTDNGVYRWNGDTLRHFTVRDGLSGREVNRAAGLAAPDGSVWIGTSSGLSVYRPDRDVSRPRGPLVTITSLDVDGSVHPSDSPVELTTDAGTLLFSFRAISFVDETAVRFRTRLEGFDAGWSEAVLLPQRSVRYTNVPPGSYRMHVRAIDAAGAESPVASSAPITIRPPLLH
ncbi:MAG TPA: two-component regulator propeller domain-containing protein, partial [bacterium]|nr:two-component regulator propeller domain-containing protein [bacterium]